MEKIIYNMTAHNLTHAQVVHAKALGFEVGAPIEAIESLKAKLKGLKAEDDLNQLAFKLIQVLEDNLPEGSVVLLPIGSPAFMFTLAMKGLPLLILFSHSERESVETCVDGVVTKVSIFSHKGFHSVGGQGGGCDYHPM